MKKLISFALFLSVILLSNCVCNASGYRAYWDINFEKGYSVNMDKSVGSYLLQNGQVIQNESGGRFSVNAGNSTNAITIEEATAITNNYNGTSLVLTTNDATAECQANDISIEETTGKLVISYDYATSEIVSKNVGRIAYSEQADAEKYTNWIQINLNKDGQFTFEGQTVLGDCVANQWYNIRFLIDIDANTVQAYLDGEYKATYSPTALIGKIWKIGISNLKTGVSATYVDNFKAYSIYDEAVSPQISSVSYKIGEEDVKALRSGTLSARACLTNNGSQNDMVCIFAVYNSGELKALSSEDVSFLQDDTQIYTSWVNLGEVSEDSTVKVMLWKRIVGAVN